MSNKIIITLDGGTTNTRIRLCDNGRIVYSEKIPIGARAGIDDKFAYRNSVRDAILKLTDKCEITITDLEAIVASGMITSEGGLCEVPHIKAPAGINELAANIKCVKLPEIAPIPFYFIPGVRCDGERSFDTDVMRGEETELIGISSFAAPGTKSAFVLPGSHSKLIFTDETGRIERFYTSLTGEMIASISKDTILKTALDLLSELDERMLLAGYDYCEECGLNQALFKVRVLKNFHNRTASEVYSFFIGAILHDEIKMVANADIERIVLAGQSRIKEATGILLKHKTNKVIVIVPDEIAENASCIGMIRIYEHHKEHSDEN